MSRQDRLEAAAAAAEADAVMQDEPTERVDTKILETLVELEDGRELPLGLRVQAFIERRRASSSEPTPFTPPVSTSVLPYRGAC